MRGGDSAVDVIQDVRRQRRERVEDGRTIFEEPDRRTIVRQGDRLIIQHDETERLRRGNRDAQVERAQDGVTRTIIIRDGVRVITEVDEQGRLLRRLRRDREGREVILLENAPQRRGSWESSIVELPLPQITMPRERYIRDVRRASRAQVLETFEAPPVQRIERQYSIEEVRRSPNLLARMARVDVDTVTFASGSWTLDADQIALLQVVADSMAQVIERNTNEIFLVEGHTDAVGGDVDNLSLSDRRAETVAVALTDSFNVPAENLVTQGFGESQLKIPTDQAEPVNRRVTVRRITPLLQGRNEAK